MAVSINGKWYELKNNDVDGVKLKNSEIFIKKIRGDAFSPRREIVLLKIVVSFF